MSIASGKPIIHQNVYIFLSTLYLMVLLALGKVSATSILFVYFLETLVIGVFNALKMYWTIRADNETETSISNFGVILFFLVHYGFFVAIQSIFVFAIFSIDSNLFKEPFYIFENYTIVLSLKDVQYALPAIIFMNLGKFLSDFLGRKKYLQFKLEQIMFKPYVRIIIQQFVVIISFFFIAFTDAGYIAASLLIIIRFVVDFFFESIQKDSKMLDMLSEKLATEKVSKEEIKKQLISFTE